MTNGEKLCIDFPNMGYVISRHRVITTIGVANSFDLDWWNAEYEEPSSSEIPTGSDDKNDLGVAISREDALMCLTGKFEIREYEPSELISIFSKRIKALPPVTPIRHKGRWIKKYHADEDGLEESCSAECSSCHKRSNGYAREDGYGLKFMYYDFCPKCGSDNREVKNANRRSNRIRKNVASNK